MCVHGTEDDPLWDMCATGEGHCLGHRNNGPPVSYIRHDCVNLCRTFDIEKVRPSAVLP